LLGKATVSKSGKRTCEMEENRDRNWEKTSALLSLKRERRKCSKDKGSIQRYTPERRMMWELRLGSGMSWELVKIGGKKLKRKG